jgi:hypothetical protein
VYLSPVLKDRKLELNQDGVICFVAAELLFLMETSPDFQSLVLKKEYFDFLESSKGKESFQRLHKHMHLYYKGEPDLDKALWHLSYAYLGAVWGITILTRDPVLVMGYASFLSEMRVIMTKTFIGALAELSEKRDKVILNCKITGDEDNESVRIWDSTFLVNDKLNHKSKLINAFNISRYPEWTKIEIGEILNFKLEFTPLPEECSEFDLIEDIPESGGWVLRGIKRNRSDIYEIEI